MMTITTNIITANMLKAKAISHPQLKKYFTSTSHNMNWIIAAIMPVKNVPKNWQRLFREVIHMASVKIAMHAFLLLLTLICCIVHF